MKLYFDDEEFDGQLQRAVFKAYDRCADIGECLATAQRIAEKDYDGWYDQWWATAEQARDIAQTCSNSGRWVNAREAYLRAAEYYRTAYFFRRSDLDDLKLLATWQRHRECFRAAAALFDHPCDVIEIPYEGTTLSGYFIRPTISSEPGPIVVSFPGYDATAEEMYFMWQHRRLDVDITVWSSTVLDRAALYMRKGSTSGRTTRWCSRRSLTSWWIVPR